MPEYLTDEWFTAAAAAIGTVAAPSETTVQFQVNGAASYQLVIGPDSTVRTDTTSPADVTLTMDYAIAAAIARGDRSAQDAFMAGELRLGGDAMALVRANEHLEAATDPFAALRAETTYRDA